MRFRLGETPFYDPKTALRRHPRRPKIAPRRLQDDLEELPFSSSFWPSILIRFGPRFGFILAPFWAPKTAPKSIQTSIKNNLAARWPPRPLQDRPRASQDAPRTPPDPPQDPPGPSQNAPQEPPGRFLDRPKTRKLRNRQK